MSSFIDWRAWRTRGSPAKADWTWWERGDVNNIDKERWGKESDSIIVIVGVGKEVRTAGEGIGAG